MQGLTILLAMILKALGPHQERYYYESDDDYIPDRVPLLKNYVPSPSYVVGDPMYGPKNDGWNIRINSKVGILYRFIGKKPFMCSVQKIFGLMIYDFTGLYVINMQAGR